MRSPLHAQLTDELRRRIAAGELTVGDPLPSESALMAEFGSSRGTVRQALATLRNEGLIGGGQGRPPVVRAEASSQPFDTFLSFTAWAEQLGRTPGARTIEVAKRPATPLVADSLGLEVGTPVVELLRLRLLDGAPAMLERGAFIERVGRLLFTVDLDAGSLYGYLIDAGVAPDLARHTIDAVPADSADAELLGIAAGSPLLRERRIATSADGEPIESATDLYRPDRVSFTVVNARTARSPLVRTVS